LLSILEGSDEEFKDGEEEKEEPEY